MKELSALKRTFWMIYLCPLKVSPNMFYANSKSCKRLKAFTIKLPCIKKQWTRKKLEVKAHCYHARPFFPSSQKQLITTDQHNLSLHKGTACADAGCKHEEKVSSLVRKLWAERKPCDGCNTSRAIHWQKPRVAGDQSWLVTPSWLVSHFHKQKSREDK